jgi:hypothetical protein
VALFRKLDLKLRAFPFITCKILQSILAISCSDSTLFENRGGGSISKVEGAEGHWPKGALLYMTKIKRFYVVHEPNENI